MTLAEVLSGLLAVVVLAVGVGAMVVSLVPVLAERVPSWARRPLLALGGLVAGVGAALVLRRPQGPIPGPREPVAPLDDPEATRRHVTEADRVLRVREVDGLTDADRAAEDARRSLERWRRGGP